MTTLRERLHARTIRTLAFVNVAEPSLLEIAAHVGFDAVLIDAEHGALTIADVQTLVRAADAVGLPNLVRVPVVSREHILRSLDAGAQGVLAPQISAAAEAEEVVFESRYPPAGSRGAGFYARAHRYSLDRGRAALDSADRKAAVGVQIETVPAVEAAEGIAQVAGLDLVFLGPTDLSVAHGSCDPGHPWMQTAIAEVARACHAANVPSGIYAGDGTAAERYLAMGYDTVAVGILPLLVPAARDYVAQAFEAARRVPGEGQ